MLARGITVTIQLVRHPLVLDLDLALHVCRLVLDHRLFLYVLVLHFTRLLLCIFTLLYVAVAHLFLHRLFLHFLRDLPWTSDDCGLLLKRLFFVGIEGTFTANHWVSLWLQTFDLGFQLLVFFLILFDHDAIGFILFLVIFPLPLEVLLETLQFLFILLQVLIARAWFELTFHDPALVFNLVELVCFILLELFFFALKL